MNPECPTPEAVERAALVAELARLRAENDTLKATLMAIGARVDGALSPGIPAFPAIPTREEPTS